MAGWVVIVPVKGLGAAKSRLDSPSRSDLALAFALDVVAVAAPAVDAVLVVTADREVAMHVAALGARVVDEPAHDGEPSLDPLNAAVTAGLRAAARQYPHASVAVLTSDLPALTVGALTDALRRAERHPLALVTDAAAEGTTMLTARDAASVTPRFGVGSRRRHEMGGHVLLPIPDGSPLRRDVDDAADLRAAVALGVGPRTAAALGSRPGADRADSAQREPDTSAASPSAAEAIAADSSGPDR